MVMGQMVLDCENMSPSARAYATEHGLCSADGDVGTQDIRYGNCGYSYIYVWNNGKHGVADFGYGFGSDLGPVVWRSLRVNWSNLDLGKAGSFTDRSVMAGTTYAAIRSATTGVGEVFAGLTGYVTLLWGGECTLLVSTDYGIIW